MTGSERFLNGIRTFYQVREKTGGIFGPHSFTPGLEATYWASSYPALALSLTGMIDDWISPEQKKQWFDYLLTGQDAGTGFFMEPVTDANKPEGPVHKSEDIFWHGATFVIGALHVLGGNPAHPFKAIEKYKNREAMESWLEELPWKDPWKAGNWTYDMGCIMGSDYLITGEKSNLGAMDAFFDWHDGRTDPETGWWNIAGDSELFRQQYGGYHTLMVYWMYGREVPDPEKMIVSSLKLQCGNGSYGNMGCCGDMDVIDSIVTLSRQYGICMKEVRESVEKFYPCLMSLIDCDGGFIGSPGEEHIDLGWKLHRGEKGRSDACSTYFRTFTLSLVNEILELEWLDDVKWKHMDGFCHGRRPECLL